LSKEINDARILIEQLPNDPESIEGIGRNIESKFISCEDLKKEFKMECRLISNYKLKKDYENQLSVYEEEIISLRKRLQMHRSEHQRSRGGPKNDDDLIDEMHRIQNKTEDSLNNIENLIVSAQEIGLSTLKEQKYQRKQLERIEEKTYRLEDSARKTDKMLKRFGRRKLKTKLKKCFHRDSKDT